ncbi:putative haloacid dehalogenase-like hydrolase [Sphaerisporangium melleum]|uniref:Haloacid dehalogenase-like hydrolase n=2 Tax=Sphaerisporangium melleum TaxID=321316 RepID=A0A917VT15_9ACTN|nr:HAD-IA family hydrolase [Sphaerisporangium melleum]GGL11251.1 putative haloacid dehalogenase-like hydrolase [Sphaerisporangium melleum]GII71750.1 putative haloacid dehalogenase-like hydrolase [Sphaerisporangium melleum]
MTDASSIKLACLDLAGTTIGDIAMVERAFADAIATQGIVPGTGAYARAMVHVHRSRGCPKIEVFRGIFPGNEAQAQAANLTFERAYEDAIERAGLFPVPGTVEALEKLRAADVKICVITGFSRATLSRVLSVAGWMDQIDLALCPEDTGRGRPWPDMVLTAVLRLRIDDVRQVAVVGDTESDMLCGSRAGASIVAGVLTGVHSRERLLHGGANVILDSIADFPGLVLNSDAAKTPAATSSR